MATNNNLQCNRRENPYILSVAENVISAPRTTMPTTRTPGLLTFPRGTTTALYPSTRRTTTPEAVQTQGTRTPVPTADIKCYNCGAKGHFSCNCLELRKLKVTCINEITSKIKQVEEKANKEIIKNDINRNKLLGNNSA